MKKLIFGSLFVISAVAAQAQTFSGITFYGGHEYGLFAFDGSIPNSWDAANTYANTAFVAPGVSFHLATLTSAGEDAAVGAMVSASGLGEVWLGGYQAPTEMVANAGWNWVTSEPWSYTNWNSGEPNDAYGAGSEQNLAMWNNGKWNDEGNTSNISGFVVEAQPSVPAPAALVPFALGLIASRRRSRRS